MKVKLHPNSSKEEIKKIEEDNYGVWLREKPINNKANIKLVKMMKKYLGKEVKMKSGFTSRNKILDIK